MIYRWFWRCSSDPNTHSSFTGTSWVSEERKTFSRPADGRKMKRDHPNCWTAQLNTIVKTFSCVCVCVWTVQMIGSDTDHQPSAQSPRVQMVRDHPAGVGFHLQHLLLSSLSWRCDSSKTFFTRRQSSFLRWGKETQVFLCSKVQITERSAASWEVFLLTVVFLFNVLKQKSEDAQVTMSKPQHAWIYYQYINIYTNKWGMDQ